VNGDRVDSLSAIVHRETSYIKGRDLCIKMKELIPMQQFEVAIQASIGSRVIAKTVVKALRKNVTAKCYGGDISRKRKLARTSERGQEAHETGGQRGNPARGVPGHFEGRLSMLMSILGSWRAYRQWSHARPKPSNWWARPSAF
jgi:hypothetical protein